MTANPGYSEGETIDVDANGRHTLLGESPAFIAAIIPAASR